MYSVTWGLPTFKKLQLKKQDMIQQELWKELNIKTTQPTIDW